LHVDGGEYFPSGNIRVIDCLHLLHSKLISTTRGLTVLTFTAVPRTETSLSVKSPKDDKILKLLSFLYSGKASTLASKPKNNNNNYKNHYNDYMIYQYKLLLSSSAQS